MFNTVRNRRGMSLIEVMVSGAMTIIISLGVATMMQNSFKEQRRVVLLDTLRNQKTRIETMMRDQAIWNATMTGNAAIPLFANLKAGSDVSGTMPALTSPIKFQIFNADGQMAYDLLGPASTTGNGFTEKGTVCTTFNATPGSGNDECPFSYRMLIGATCGAVGGSNSGKCTNPQLKIVARLVFNPSSTGPLANFTNLVSPVNTSSIADTIQDNKYDVVVKRTSTAINRSFRIISGFVPGGGATSCSNLGGAGTCSTAVTPAVHPVTYRGVAHNWTSDATYGGFDTYNLVTSATATSGGFSFNETGFYGCLISVPAFATQGFSAYLYAGATPVASSAVTAGLWVQATAVIDAKFNVTSTSTEYFIRQKCDALPVAPAPSPSNAAEACTLGFSPATSYTSFLSVISISCYKMDRSM